MIRKYIIEVDDSFKGFDEEIARLEREWGAEEIEPSEDAISREALLDKICNVDGMEEFENSNIFAKHYVDIVKASPSVTSQPKKGHWKDCSNGWCCSNCWRDVSHESDFCPHCGADMRES